MKFSIVTLLAAAGLAIAQTPGFDAITWPTQDQTIQAGSSFEIVWVPAAQKGEATIALLQGASPSTLELGPVIASAIDNQVGKFVWSPVPDAQFATYGFKISLDSNPGIFQYSFPFHIAGKVASSSTVSSLTVGSTSTSTKDTSTTDCTTPGSVVSYPTTMSIASYPAYPTTTVPAYRPTYPASSNGTWVKPSGTGCTTTPVLNTTAPTRTPSVPTPQGAAARFGTGGFAAINGLLLAFAFSL